MRRYLENYELPAKPTDYTPRRIWDAVLVGRLATDNMIERGDGRRYIRLGPWSRDFSTVRMFILQSVFYQTIARQGAWVINELTLEEVEHAWRMTYDPQTTWLDALELIRGEYCPGWYRKTIIKPYALCLATRDPFGLQEGLERLAAEAHYTSPSTGKRKLLSAVSAYVKRLPDRTLAKDAIIAGIRREKS